MPHDVWQKVVNLRLYGSEVAPPGVPQFWLKKPRKQMDRSKKAERKPRTKKRPMRRSRKAEGDCRRRHPRKRDSFLPLRGWSHRGGI